MIKKLLLPKTSPMMIWARPAVGSEVCHRHQGVSEAEAGNSLFVVLHRMAAFMGRHAEGRYRGGIIDHVQDRRKTRFFGS